MVEIVPAEQGCFCSSLKSTELQNHCVFPEIEPRLKQELQILIKYLKPFLSFYSSSKMVLPEGFFSEL